LYKSDLKHFISICFDLQFLDSFALLFSTTPDEEIISKALEMSMGKSHPLPNCPAFPGIKMELQKVGYNCHFAAYFSLYEFLLIKKYGAEKARQQANGLRFEFRRFLAQMEQNNPELLQDVLRQIAH
jgi:hypothetical protein